MCWGCDCCDLLGLCLTAKFSWYLSPPCFLECLFPTTQTLCMKTFCCSWHFLTVEPHSALNLWRSTMCYNSKWGEILEHFSSWQYKAKMATRKDTAGHQKEYLVSANFGQRQNWTHTDTHTPSRPVDVCCHGYIQVFMSMPDTLYWKIGNKVKDTSSVAAALAQHKL